MRPQCLCFSCQLLRSTSVVLVPGPCNGGTPSDRRRGGDVTFRLPTNLVYVLVYIQGSYFFFFFIPVIRCDVGELVGTWAHILGCAESRQLTRLTCPSGPHAGIQVWREVYKIVFFRQAIVFPFFRRPRTLTCPCSGPSGQGWRYVEALQHRMDFFFQSRITFLV